MRWVFLLNVGRLLLKAHELGIPVIIFTFWRSPEDQVKEFYAGRSRTISGLHPRWLAIDLALWDDMDKDGTVDKVEIRWERDPRYTTLGQYWESLGGVWGGRWKDPYDPYHFEWSDQMKV
jgi:hypothetical protein